jgi:hypothetical protein
VFVPAAAGVVLVDAATAQTGVLRAVEPRVEGGRVVKDAVYRHVTATRKSRPAKTGSFCVCGHDAPGARRTEQGLLAVVRDGLVRKLWREVPR